MTTQPGVAMAADGLLSSHPMLSIETVGRLPGEIAEEILRWLATQRRPQG